VQFLSFIEAFAVLTIQPFDADSLAKSARLARKFSDRNRRDRGAPDYFLLVDRSSPRPDRSSTGGLNRAGGRLLTFFALLCHILI